MSLIELRKLFELLCEQMEDGGFFQDMHYEAGYGIEMPHGVVMMFVFQEAVLMCRFSLQESLADNLSADDCISMTEDLWKWKGGFKEMFGEEQGA